jgi:ABC-type transport system substrate-binding protein
MAFILANRVGFLRVWPLALVGWLLVLASCGGPADGLNAEQARRVFRYNQPEALTSLDPAFTRNQANIWASSQLYNGLLELDSTLQPAPALARRYAISPDGRTYTFWLRRSVRFHDSEVFAGGRGREVRASDFVYSFKRLLDAKTASPGGWIFRGKVLEDSKGDINDTCFVAVNDSTLRIHLKEPFIPFLSILTMPYAFVVPHEVVAKYGKDFGQHPVGTGPFRFRLWDVGNVLLLHRNPQYWRRDAQRRPQDGVSNLFAGQARFPKRHPRRLARLGNEC